MYSEDLPMTGAALTLFGVQVGLPTIALIGLAAVVAGMAVLRLSTRRQRG